MIFFLLQFQDQSMSGEPVPPTLLPCVQHSAQLVPTGQDPFGRQEARETSVIPQVLPRVE